MLREGDTLAVWKLDRLERSVKQLAEMQKIIDAEKSGLFDVLACIRCAMEPLTREKRAEQAEAIIGFQKYLYQN